MLLRTALMAFTALCLLGACDRAEEPAVGKVAETPVSTVDGHRTAVSGPPEHFDRVRAEQVEREEEQIRLKRRD